MRHQMSLTIKSLLLKKENNFLVEFVTLINFLTWKCLRSLMMTPMTTTPVSFSNHDNIYRLGVYSRTAIHLPQKRSP